MKIEPRFRIGPFQVSGGSLITLVIVGGVVGLCVCLPLAQALIR